MNTKKFDVSFNGAHYLSGNHEIEMGIYVITDHAHHYCRLRMEGPPDAATRSVWVGGGRSYSPEQEAHVKQLCEYRLPDVRASVEAWLAEHRFGAIYERNTIDIRLDQNLEVTSMSYREN